MKYVALGDSYSSGTGTRTYYESGCQRSVYAYPYLTHNASFLAALDDSEPLTELFSERPVAKTTTAKQMMSRSGRGGSTQAIFLATLLL